MTLDKEFDVAVEAVKLVISILKYHPDILSDKARHRVIVEHDICYMAECYRYFVVPDPHGSISISYPRQFFETLRARNLFLENFKMVRYCVCTSIVFRN
jgi:hypothetical protein